MFYFLRPMSLPEWVVLGISAFLCFIPGLATTGAGVVLFAAVYLNQQRRLREEVTLRARLA
ncbi:MAG: hypothetical protein ACE5JJ_06580 [Nitrospinota bacterium]